MTGIEDQLAEYLKNAPKEPGGRPADSETARQLEQIFDDLNLPWRADGRMWAIDADVGLVSAGISDDEEVLTIFQILGPWNHKMKKKDAFLESLLHINAQSRGASYAIFGDRDDGDEEKLGIVAGVAAQNLNKEEIAFALTSLFEMSQIFD